MVASIVVIVLVLAIAGYHFTEGFFSALISAIAAVLGAVLAVSYCEPVVTQVFHGSMADSAHSIALVLLFVVGYSVIRMVIDKLIPGNVRTPATLDKVGGALMGLVAGTFAVGIFTIALQMLPFGPAISLFGYTRFPVGPSDRPVYVHYGGNKNDDDAMVHYQMVDSSLDADKETGKLWLPADDVVLNTVYHLSDGGSLAGSRTLASIHPDWLGEIFGERLGEQTGNRRVALVTPANHPVAVDAVFRGEGLPTFDGYGQTKARVPDLEIRPLGYKQPWGDTLSSKGGLVPLVLRVKVRSTATDDADHVIRFSPAQVRLVVRSEPADNGEFRAAKDYYPIGFMEDGRVVTNRIDDFLFLNTAEATGFDAVFMVDKSILVGGKNKTTEVAPGTFINVKRLATVDVAGMTVADTYAADKDQKLQRSDALKAELHPEPH